jgi:hypothetical protein
MRPHPVLHHYTNLFYLQFRGRAIEVKQKALQTNDGAAGLSTDMATAK